MGFGMMETVFPIMFFLIFGVIVVMILITVVRGLSQWHSNNESPVLTVEAEVVAKRADVSHDSHHDANGMDHYSTSTTYYATFQVESGDRIELHVPDREYGMLVEGDRGRLTFQGTRYQGFERQT
ncbi:hypothetical protein CE91St41_17500 [Oscillospiraceae bacterium]|nr:hypothetical protein CE91St40_20040 [Oscillospiraceae bacterium]BDF74861.1 hypothetical protein CE91St41_17500 [Oscillospiraceae bacterium]